MQILKPAEADKEFFRALVPERADVTIKPMFGNLGAFVNGNMFMGLFGVDVGIKLAESDREKLLAINGAGPFGPEERPMSGYVSLPQTWRATPKKAEVWIAKAVEHVAALPAKKAKKA